LILNVNHNINSITHKIKISFKKTNRLYSSLHISYKCKKNVKNYVGVSQILGGFIHLKITVNNRILFKERYYLDLGLGGVYQKYNYDYGITNSNKIQLGYIASFGYLLPLWKSKDDPSE
jgi:tRNA A-37 threonylcarbamoyl transferase component Bud32